MLPDKMEHCIVFMNSWDVSDVFWSFSKCNITIPHFPTVPSTSRLGQENIPKLPSDTQNSLVGSLTLTSLKCMASLFGRIVFAKKNTFDPSTTLV